LADYVLVHGAWGSGSQYCRLAQQLGDAGHRVLIAQLTGLGARAHLVSSAIDLATHIQDVVAQIGDAEFHDIVLVGHSYGGMVVTGVLGQLGSRIAHIVYLDAFLPCDGQSLWDVVGAWEHEHYIAGQRETPGLVAPLPGIDPKGVLGRHPLLTFIQPVRFTGKEAEVKRKSYIFASGWQPTPFGRFHDQVKDDPDWQVHTIDCGHFVMGDAPEKLLDILLDAE
jgi:pimeloyl-ACP methyl ester carboxylesterase